MSAAPPILHVGVAEIAVVAARHLLVSSALGSCVGVALFDRATKVAALAHVMLPAEFSRNGQHPEGKFADVAIPSAVEDMRLAGAVPGRLVAKIAGGAEMFAASGMVGIGERNVLAVKEALRSCGIRVAGADTGGHHARTVEFDTGTGLVTIRSVRYGIKEL